MLGRGSIALLLALSVLVTIARGETRPEPVAARDRDCAARYPGTQWNGPSATGKGECGCPDGHWWSDGRNRCVAFLVYAQDYCDANYPSQSPQWVDRPGGAFRCVCPAEAPWSEVQRRCVGQDYARHWCASRYGGTEPLFKSATEFDCACPPGSWLNARLNRCLPARIYADDDCATRYPGTVPRWLDAQRWNCEPATGSSPPALPAHAPAAAATAPPSPAFDCEQSIRETRRLAQIDASAASAVVIGAIAAGCDYGRLQQAIDQGRADAAARLPPPAGQPGRSGQPPLFEPTRPPVAVSPPPAVTVPAPSRPAPPPAASSTSRCAWTLQGGGLLGQSDSVFHACYCGLELRTGNAATAACGPRPR